MTLVARRRAAVLVPWLALVAVTVFAVVQMRARHEAEQGSPPAVVVVDTPVEPVPASAQPDIAAAAHAAEAALDAALQDLEVARAKAVARDRALGAESVRAEAAEARLAAEIARREALEAAEETLEAPPPAPPAEAPPAAAETTDELAAWVEDATSDERQRRLSAAEKAGDLTDDAVIALLLDEGAPLDRSIRLVRALGPETLLRPAVLEAILARATPGVLKVALGPLAAHESDLGDAGRRTQLAAVLTPRLAADDFGQLHAGARAAGLLRLPSLALRLAGLLVHEEPAVRVAAAHALSLVPDLDAARADAVKALPGLLLDNSRSVRTAGALLAEALVGAPIDYDPAAGEGARREALDRLLDRLE